MREKRLSGSVRGVGGNPRLYRDRRNISPSPWQISLWYPARSCGFYQSARRRATPVSLILQFKAENNRTSAVFDIWLSNIKTHMSHQHFSGSDHNKWRSLPHKNSLKLLPLMTGS